jgi:ABC-type polysaccharide transport system permease subunit
MILPVVLYYILFKYWPMLWLRIAFYEPNTEAMGYPICCL